MARGWTANALRAGGLASVAVFVIALVLHVAGLEQEATALATLGVLTVIGTPSVALVATVAESLVSDRTTAWLALAVLAVLGVATVISLFLR
ncbi:MAG TPA: hypothetical protein VMZ33_00885 [Candidatus Limnocylindrales bacterium]|nr:hypothetical protein [Candidatus Limnocylindrales bacterium]